MEDLNKILVNKGWEEIETMVGSIYSKQFINKDNKKEFVIVSDEEIAIRETPDFNNEPIDYIDNIDNCDRYSKEDIEDIKFTYNQIANFYN
jgi:hypothetical protein